MIEFSGICCVCRTKKATRWVMLCDENDSQTWCYECHRFAHTYGFGYIGDPLIEPHQAHFIGQERVARELAWKEGE